MTLTLTVDPVRVDAYQQADVVLRTNGALYDARRHADVCFLCGRPLTRRSVDNGLFVHLTTGGYLVGADYPEAGDGEDPLYGQSQGAFPVGAECARRLPRGLAFRIPSAPGETC